MLQPHSSQLTQPHTSRSLIGRSCAWSALQGAPICAADPSPGSTCSRKPTPMAVPPPTVVPAPAPGGSRDCTDHPPWSPGAARGSLDCCRVRMRIARNSPQDCSCCCRTALLSLSLVEGKSQAECQRPWVLSSAPSLAGCVSLHKLHLLWALGPP